MAPHFVVALFLKMFDVQFLGNSPSFTYEAVMPEIKCLKALRVTFVAKLFSHYYTNEPPRAQCEM